jgi:hypothetical protein
MASQETFPKHASRIEVALATLPYNPVVVSTDVPKLYLETPKGITKQLVVWPLYEHKMYYITTVVAGTSVDLHSHEEDMFRLVITGGFSLSVSQGRRHGHRDRQTYEITQGMWVVVRANTNYSIATPSGYQCLSGYIKVCSQA